MCLTIYMASEHELPLVPWREDAPDFYIDEPDGRAMVKQYFTLPYIAYVGSDQGCGCGFIKEGNIGDDLEIVDGQYRKLARYIENLSVTEASVQIYCYWDGQQGSGPEFNESIHISNLLSSEFEFKEDTFYQISNKTNIEAGIVHAAE